VGAAEPSTHFCPSFHLPLSLLLPIFFLLYISIILPSYSSFFLLSGPFSQLGDLGGHCEFLAESVAEPQLKFLEDFLESISSLAAEWFVLLMFMSVACALSACLRCVTIGCCYCGRSVPTMCNIAPVHWYCYVTDNFFSSRCFDIFVVLMRLVIILEFCQMKVKYFDVNGHFINFDYRTSHFSLVYTV